MNEINFLYTTVSDGQLHIAADTKYIGCVDSYNNFFTRFLAWIFDRSVSVNFDGQSYSLNKQSYANLLQTLNVTDKINTISSRCLFRPIAEAAKLPSMNLKMRDMISSYDRQALFQKLAIAISKGNTTEALMMIGKGAELDLVYYDRSDLSPSFTTDTLNLKAEASYSFTVFVAAPMLQAARKGNLVVCQFLKEAGANLAAVGKEYFFKREITNVSTAYEYRPVFESVPHYHHTKDIFGNKRTTVEHELECNFKLKEKTVVNTQDSRIKETYYQLDPDNFDILKI